MRIQQSVIDEIIEKTDIVEVVGEYVKLEKKGNDYKGLCPFHNDSNPSLSVSPAKKIYKCFSCNEAGNVVRFIEKIKNVSYVESLKILADKYNIPLELKENPKFEKYKKGYKIVKEVSSLYEFYLKNTVEGKEALDYLHNRSLSDEIIKRFEIGLSSKKDNIICKSLLESEKYLPLDLMEVKLIDRNKNGKYYDLFNSRIMFPIKDLNGNYIGFSGRAFPKGDPKYINSVENYIFKKGNILYNYSDCINDIKLKNRVYLFEGFMDVIAAYRSGVTNSVASMGTSLTENQIKAIKNLTSNVTVCYDSDEPGINATKRAIKMLLDNGLNVNVIFLTETKDADEYVKEHGEKALFDYLDNKQLSCVDYFYETSKMNLNLNDPNSVINFQKDVYNTIKMFKNKAFESYLLKKMSNDLNIQENDLQSDLHKYIPEVSYEEEDIPDFDDSSYLPIDVQDSKTIKIKKHRKKKYLTAENGLIYLAYNDRKHCMHIRTDLGFRSYVDKVNRSLLYKLYDYYMISNTMNSNDFFKKLNADEADRLNLIINSQNIFNDEEIDVLINTVLEYQYEKESSILKENIENKNNASIDDLVKLIENKKKLTKINKKKEN